MVKNNIFKRKTKRPFSIVLGLVSILGFLTIALVSFFEITFLEKFQSGIIFIILGIGFWFEGNAKQLFKGKIRQEEIVPKSLTTLMGILSIVVGIMALIGFSNIRFETIKGIVSIVNMFVIFYEVFLID